MMIAITLPFSEASRLNRKRSNSTETQESLFSTTHPSQFVKSLLAVDLQP